MKKVTAEPLRDIDFTGAKRGSVVPQEPGKTKIFIRIDNSVIGHFRAQVERAGAGNYQTLMNDALVSYIHQTNIIEAVRQVVHEELARAHANSSVQKTGAVVA